MPAGRLRLTARAGAAGLVAVGALAVTGAHGTTPPGGKAGVASQAAAPAAHRWTDALARPVTPIPITYHQGMAAHGAALFFSGIAVGLYRTDRSLRVRAARQDAIPARVARRDGYDHIGDIAYDDAGGGRLLLPLECYPATCRTGAIGVADPRSLRWRYEVALDPSAVSKAMWVEVSPDRRWILVSSGADLVAFRRSDVRASHAFPRHAPIRPAWRWRGILPLGVTGAAVDDDRLLLATQRGGAARLWSIDLRTGARRLLRTVATAAESEGIAVTGRRRGVVHWELQPRRLAAMDLLRSAGRLLNLAL